MGGGIEQPRYVIAASVIESTSPLGFGKLWSMTTDMDEAWATQMLERLQRGTQEARRRRDELADAVDELATGFTMLGKEPWKFVQDSAAFRDNEAPDVALGERTESVANILRYESAVNIRSAADQLRGFAVLLRAEASLMGAVSVSRGVFEACLWAAGLIDPTISTDERLKRALTRRLARLSAGIRLQDMLGGEVSDNDRDDEDDQHGSNRNPAEDAEAIEAYANARGWPVKTGRRAKEITALSIDWLAENLEQRLGIESYTWTSGSSMSHCEHAADTASWIELSQDFDIAPAWLIRLWSSGVWAGPRLFLATLAVYTGTASLSREYERLERLFEIPGSS